MSGWWDEVVGKGPSGKYSKIGCPKTHGSVQLQSVKSQEGKNRSLDTIIEIERDGLREMVSGRPTLLSIFYIRVTILHKLVRISMRLTTRWVTSPRKLKSHAESLVAFIWTNAGDAGEKKTRENQFVQPNTVPAAFTILMNSATLVLHFIQPWEKTMQYKRRFI